jgi:hypothetical protein
MAVNVYASTGGRGSAAECDAVQNKDQRKKVYGSNRGPQQNGYGNGNNGNGNGKEHRKESHRRNGRGGGQSKGSNNKSSGLKMTSKFSSPIGKRPPPAAGNPLEHSCLFLLHCVWLVWSRPDQPCGGAEHVRIEV